MPSKAQRLGLREGRQRSGSRAGPERGLGQRKREDERMGWGQEGAWKEGQGPQARGALDQMACWASPTSGH